jgi:uncharacterized protein (DUF433 family)
MPEFIDKQYITRNPNILGGEPIIAGTRTPVRSIVEYQRLGYSPPDMIRAMPYLRLSEVYAALSYYHDHEDELNEQIEENRIPDELIDPLVRDL